MKKSIVLTATLALSLSVFPISQANEAEATTKDVKYSTCKELNKVYSHGVRSSKDTKNAVKSKKTNKTTYKETKAAVSASLYKLNVHLDNDKDNIACEK